MRRVLQALQRLMAPRPGFAELLENPRAHRRSLDLLLRSLNPAQRAEFNRSGAFTVFGKSGRCYRITYGSASNVEVLTRTGKIDHRLCAAPVGVPTPAVMLTQKLMLETQEAEFLRIAVKHRVTGFPAAADPVGLPGP